MKLGVYGHGPQSRRYLDRKNWPDGVKVVQLERGSSARGLDGAIVANRPANHTAITHGLLSERVAVLCEKPVGLGIRAGEILFNEAKYYERPVLVAHTHLWSADFLRLPKSSSATVQWRGPEREDGSCPAMLDWGPHAWSMALALGTERVSTGKGDRRENMVRSGRDFYPSGSSFDTPMRSMLATFASLIDGGYDWRAEPDFALEVHRRCFRPNREPIAHHPV